MSRTHPSHRMRETSITSYGEIPNLGERQQIVFDTIIKFNLEGQYPTDRELANRLEYSDPNNIRPRRFELMKFGLIIEAGKRICSISKKRALIWKVSPHMKDKIERKTYGVKM